MPVKKGGDNRKNLPKANRDDRVIPKKEEGIKKKLKTSKIGTTPRGRVNALSTQGKKKKPK
jgi:hypothetical protein